MTVDLSRCFPISSVPTEEEASQLTTEVLLNTCENLASLCMEQSSRRGSLYCGGLGPHAFLRLKLARQLHHRNKKKASLILQGAHDSAKYALDRAGDDRRATLLESTRIGALSMLVSIDTMIKTVGQAAVETKLSGEEIVDEIARKSHLLSSSECEVLYGRAGALAGVFYLRKELDSYDLGRDFVVQTAIQILQEGLQGAKDLESSTVVGRLPLVLQWHDKYYLGAAHGVVGVLHTLLSLSTEEWDLVQETLPGAFQKVKETISSLASLEHASGNLVSSLSQQPIASRTDRLVHWCHGASGHCLLLVKASQVFGDLQFLRDAEEIAETVIWPRGLLRKGVGLCHGISGNGYVLLYLADATRRQSGMSESFHKWKTRALQYAKFAIDHFTRLEDVPDRPYSLFEGAAGLCCYLIDCSSMLEEASPGSSTPGRYPTFPLYDF